MPGVFVIAWHFPLNKMKKRYFVGLLLLIGFVAGCSAPAGTPTPLPVKEITLQMDNSLRFSPTEVEVVVGQPVRLILQNGGALEHDFNVDNLPLTEEPAASGGHHHHSAAATTPEAGKFNLHITATAEEAGVLEFTPTQVGQYEFYCSVTGHKDGGMIGRLIVVESE